MRDCARKFLVACSSYTHSYAEVEMASQPVSSEDLTAFKIQSFVRGRYVSYAQQLGQTLTLDVREELIEDTCRAE